jgi:hypothetical protein
MAAWLNYFVDEPDCERPALLWLRSFTSRYGLQLVPCPAQAAALRAQQAAS